MEPCVRGVQHRPVRSQERESYLRVIGPARATTESNMPILLLVGVPVSLESGHPIRVRRVMLAIKTRQQFLN